MANWSILKNAIANVIKTNGNQEITGNALQNILNNIVSNVGENATFAGIATPTTNPGIPDGPVFYIASTAGNYTNFGGLNLNANEIVILHFINSNWTKEIISTIDTSYINTLKRYIIGELGSYDNAEAFDAALVNMTKDTHSNGRYFAKVGNVPVFVTFEVLNHAANILGQWIEGAITVTSSGKINTNITTGVRIISRVYSDGVWGDWFVSALKNDIPTAQTNEAGTNRNYVYQDITNPTKYVLSGVGKLFQYSGGLKLRLKVWGTDNTSYDDGKYSTFNCPQVTSGADGAMNHDVYGRLLNHTIKVGTPTSSSVPVNYTNFQLGGSSTFTIEAASSAKAGVMTAAQYQSLKSLESRFYEFEDLTSESEALTALADSSISGNTNVVVAHAAIDSSRAVTMLQSINNDFCRQILIINDYVYQRSIYFEDGTRKKVTYVSGITPLFSDRLKWDTTNHKYVPSQFGKDFNASDTDAIPLASTTADGLMSKEDTSYINTLKRYIIGELGSYDNAEAFDAALVNMTKDTHSNGRYFAKVGNVPVFVTFEVLNHAANILGQWIEGAITVTSSGKINTNITTGVRIISRVYSDGVWGDWFVSALKNDLPKLASTTNDGLMSKEDYALLQQIKAQLSL